MLARLCRGYSDEYTEICPQGTYGQEEEIKEAVNNADARYTIRRRIQRETRGSLEEPAIR